VGQAKIELLPWTRIAGAEASKLLFKVRLCASPTMCASHPPFDIYSLKGTLLEAIDHDYRNDVETHC
jgi:hypothetical protein